MLEYSDKAAKKYRSNRRKLRRTDGKIRTGEVKKRDADLRIGGISHVVARVDAIDAIRSKQIEEIEV